MHKHILSLLALVLVAQIGWANVVTGVAAIPDGYYNSVDGKASANAILDALFNKIKDHTVISYDDLEDYYEQTDFRGDTVWDMYSTCRFTMDEANKSQSAVCDGWNKEHSIPQSWFNKQSPMKSDLFHVYPTDARVNNFRSNYPYGETSATSSGITNDPQNHALGKVGTSTTSGIGKIYEPDDEYKGDFARTYFYMVARYRDRSLDASEGNEVFTSNKTNLTDYAKDLFLKWHHDDPVSQKEIDRNQAVYGIQHNRNPFIDYPDFVDYIWGDKVGQAIDLSTMTPTCDGGGQTPVTTVKYGISWSVNGEIVSVDSIVENKKPTALPDEPTSCSSESNIFMGWTTAAINGTQDDAPAVLYTQAADFPAVTADVTYYAVFAKAEQGASSPATYTFDADHKDGWINSGGNKNGYWLLDSGKELISPEIDLSGLASIQARLRTFGGTQYDQFAFAAGSTNIGTITVTKGATMTDYTWTNTKSLTGKSPITFTCSNAGSDKGVGFSSVVINATGAGVTYTRYITTCQETTEVELVNDEAPARKILVGGQIYLQVGEQLFNLQGQRVK